MRRISNQPPPVLAVPSVPAANYFDLTLSQLVTENLSLNFGVVNLFDEDPLYSVTSQGMPIPIRRPTISWVGATSYERPLVTDQPKLPTPWVQSPGVYHTACIREPCARH